MFRVSCLAGTPVKIHQTVSREEWGVMKRREVQLEWPGLIFIFNRVIIECRDVTLDRAIFGLMPHVNPRDHLSRVTVFEKTGKFACYSTW